MTVKTAERPAGPTPAVPSRPAGASLADGRPNALRAANLGLAYPAADGGLHEVLAIDAFAVEAGARVAVTGPSGSGKTSLLYVLGGLERPRTGTVAWGATELTALGEAGRDRWRRRNVGLVFQDFHLFPGLSGLDNVLLPATFDGVKAGAAERARARALLDRVGLDDGEQRVETLSRGEMQRVAVARALLFSPPIILADEPTASLDKANAAAVAGLLLELAGEAGATLIVVTHDPGLLACFADVRRLVAGRLVPDAGGPSR